VTDPTAQPCAIKRRIALILGSCERTERSREETAEEIASFLQRLNDRVSGWDGIILLGEVALLLRGYEKHHWAKVEALAAKELPTGPERQAAVDRQCELAAETVLKAERNARMAQRLEDFVHRSIDDLPSDGNPAEVLRSLAVGLAARMGLQVDHEAFDRAAAVADEQVCFVCRKPDCTDDHAIPAT
jgi:hypothetical protein